MGHGHGTRHPRRRSRTAQTSIEGSSVSILNLKQFRLKANLVQRSIHRPEEVRVGKPNASQGFAAKTRSGTDCDRRRRRRPLRAVNLRRLSRATQDLRAMCPLRDINLRRPMNVDEGAGRIASVCSALSRSCGGRRRRRGPQWLCPGSIGSDAQPS